LILSGAPLRRGGEQARRVSKVGFIRPLKNFGIMARVFLGFHQRKHEFPASEPPPLSAQPLTVVDCYGKIAQLFECLISCSISHQFRSDVEGDDLSLLTPFSVVEDLAPEQLRGKANSNRNTAGFTNHFNR
jgi:hypothetical protein